MSGKFEFVVLKGSAMFDRLLKHLKRTTKSTEKASSSTPVVMECESMEQRNMLSGGAWTRLDAADNSAVLSVPAVTASATAGSQKVSPLVRRSPIPWQNPSWIGTFSGTINFFGNTAASGTFVLSILQVGKNSAYLAFGSATTGTVIMQGKASVDFGDVVLGKDAKITMSQRTTTTLNQIRIVYSSHTGVISGSVFQAIGFGTKINSGTFNVV